MYAGTIDSVQLSHLSFSFNNALIDRK